MDSYIKSLQSNAPTYKSLAGLKSPSTSPTISQAMNAASPLRSTINAAATSAPSAVAPKATPTPTPTPSPGGSSQATPQLGTQAYSQYLMQQSQNMLGGNAGTQQQSTPQPPPPKDPRQAYFDAQKDYLSQYTAAIKPSAEREKAALDLANLRGTMDERSLEARRKYESTLDTPGMLKAGAESAARQGLYRDEQNLADLAVREGAMARTLMALTGNEEASANAIKSAMEMNQPLKLGDTYYNPFTGEVISEAKANEGFSLSEGQARYEYNPQTGQYEKIASVGKTTAAGSGGGAAGISGIAQQVMQNPALYGTLTPTVKGQVLRELAAANFDTSSLTIPNLGAGQRESINSFDTLLREAQNLTAALDTGINTGPIASRVAGAQTFFGFNPEFTQLTSIVDNMSSLLLQLRSGAAVTPSEYERIKGFIPRKTDDQRTMATKVNRFIEETNKAQQSYIERATQTPYQISQGAGSSASNNAAGADYQAYLKAISQ